jgi:hypothetical protein
LGSEKERRTEIAVMTRKIRPDVGSDDSRINMNGDRADDKTRDDKEKILQKENDRTIIFDL